MRLVLIVVALSLCFSGWMVSAPLPTEQGSFTIYRMLHAIGEESYEIGTFNGNRTLRTTFEYADRGNKVRTSVTLRMKSDYTPSSLEATGQVSAIANIRRDMATVQDGWSSRTFPARERYFTIFGSSPFAVQMLMMRYWKAHGMPTRLPVLRTSAAEEPIEIQLAGHDTIRINGLGVALDRYTIANLTFGHEILWMNAQANLAAAMTFAGGVPAGFAWEAVRTEYEAALPELHRIGVAQEMAILAEMARKVPPERTGTFAIVGATLVDGTGAAPVQNSTLIVRDGRIAAVGPHGKVTIPRDMTVVDAKGQTLLPGLLEMHTHFSGVEFGPALLAAGITTARDLGGEFDYLVAQRDAIEKLSSVGPRLLLGGLVDAGAQKLLAASRPRRPKKAGLWSITIMPPDFNKSNSTHF